MSDVNRTSPSVELINTMPGYLVEMNERLRARDERATKLANLFIKFAGELTPLLIAVRKDFLEKSRHETIFNCRTWGQYCETVLRYSQRHIDRLIQNENPAAKPRKRPAQIPEQPETAPAVEVTGQNVQAEASAKARLEEIVPTLTESQAKQVLEFIETEVVR